jgi:YVTN family beta-propeller protein
LSHMIVINHDQSKIFTANIQSDSLTVLEQRGQAGAWHATAIPVGKGPEAIDLSPDEKEVWTAHSQDGGISIVDTAAGKVVATIPSLTKHSNRLKFTPDGNLVLVSDPEGSQVLVIEAKTRKLRQRISTPAQPLGIQMTPDGKRAYVACSGAGQVAVIDLGRLAVEGTIEVGPGADGLAWVQ